MNWMKFLVMPPTFVGILMPVLLGLTIRAHKKKKNLIIPHQPFYHNDQYLSDEEIEMKDGMIVRELQQRLLCPK